MGKDEFVSVGHVKKYGEEILRFPVAHLQNTSEEDSKRLEGEIKVLLRNSGFFADKSYIKGRR